MWVEAVSSQDEGYYLCRATNGIGSGLTKVIFVAVNGKIFQNLIMLLIIIYCI